jgi:pyrimidine deaminase RibD-like protein
MDFPILKDVHYMVLSIDQAIDGLKTMGAEYGGQVGCVLVGPSGKIMDRAYNQNPAGKRTHTEEIVLSNTRSHNLTNSTLYLTIEPCNGNPFHERRHCCELIADAGIRRVVLGSLKGRYQGGADYLTSQGTRVDLLQNDDLNRLCMMLATTARAGEVVSKKSFRNILSLRERFHNY